MENGHRNQFLAFVNDEDSFQLLSGLKYTDFELTPSIHKGTPDDLITYLKANRTPKILMVDITESTLPVTDLNHVSEVCEPGVQVIAIGTRNDVGIYRDVIEVGVKDYIAKPLTAEFIRRILGNICGIKDQTDTARKQFSHGGKIVSFVGARGGVGSSTIAANTAWLMANKYFKRLCYIDNDLYNGTSQQMFHLNAPSGFRALLEEPDRIDDGMITSSAAKSGEHISVLGTQIPIDEAFEYPESAINSVMERVTKKFNYAFLDMPQINHPGQINLLLNSDVVVITLDPNLISIRGATGLLRLMKSVPNKRVVICVNRIGEYLKGELVVPLIEESLEQSVDITIPFDRSCPLDYTNQGIMLASGKTSMNDGFMSLAVSLSGGQEPQQDQDASLLRKIFGQA